MPEYDLDPMVIRGVIEAITPHAIPGGPLESLAQRLTALETQDGLSQFNELAAASTKPRRGLFAGHPGGWQTNYYFFDGRVPILELTAPGDEQAVLELTNFLSETGDPVLSRLADRSPPQDDDVIWLLLFAV